MFHSAIRYFYVKELFNPAAAAVLRQPTRPQGIYGLKAKNTCFLLPRLFMCQAVPTRGQKPYFLQHISPERHSARFAFFRDDNLST
jgi:hypothetical protein